MMTNTTTGSRLTSMANVSMLAFTALASAVLAPAPAAQAQDNWPERTVTLLVPFAPGGTTDILARIIAQGLSAELGQTVIVENQAGAGGSLGSAAVARAEANGYTLLLGAVGTHAINPSLYANLSYDPLTDFEAITPVAIVPNVLVANPAEPYDTVEQLVAYAKENPGDILFGSSGSGSSIHLSGELFRLTAEVDIDHVPYTGSGPAVTALLSNEIAVMFDNLPSSIQHIRSGSLKPLAVTTAERAEALPDVPTIAESGYPEYEATSWFGLFAPAGTPDAVVQRLHAATIDVLERDDVREQFAQQGATAYSDTPEAFASFIEDETSKWAAVVEAADVSVD